MNNKNFFKPVFIEGRNIDEVWFKLLWELNEKGRKTKIDSGSYEGEDNYRIEFDSATAIIYNPIEYSDSGIRLPLAVTVPIGCPVPTTEEKIQKYFEEYLLNGVLQDNEHYKYATFINGGEYKLPEFYVPHEKNALLINLEKNKKIIVYSQLEWIIRHFKEKGLYNNHCYIQIGYPESNLAYDIPYSNEQERGTSPCLRGLDFKVIYNKDDNKNYLTMHVYMRSNDCFNGFPENIGGFALLQEYVASCLDVEIGPLCYQSKGLHIYNFYLDALKVKLGK